jgi:hypothetical protein
MARFEISIPGSGRYEVNAPDEQTAYSALQSQLGGGSTDKPQVGVTEDVIKGAASGVGKGIASLPGALGDIQEISRMGGRALGFEPPQRSILDGVSSMLGMNKLPTSEDTVNAAAKYVPGIDRQAQTVPGQFANTIGSFIPGAVLGGEASLASAGRNAMRLGVIPGATSELAGKAFEGTPQEGIARAVGAIGGIAGRNIPGRVVSPIQQRPELAGAVSLLESEGIPLTAGQRTGNKALQWAEAAAADMPLSGTSADNIHSAQGAALNKSFAKRMGYEIQNDKGLIDEEEWKKINESFNQRYGDLTGKYALKLDNTLGQDLIKVEQDYINSVNASDIAPVVQNQIDDILSNAVKGNAIDGQKYQNLRSRLEKAAYGTKDVEKANALRGIKKSLDDAMSRTITASGVPEDVSAWQNLNAEYGNFKTLQAAATGADAGSGLGYINPQRVRAEAVKNKQRYLTGGNDLSRISKAASAAMKPLPSSGTAQRQSAMNMFQPAAAGAGLVAGGVPGFVAGYVAPSAMARLMMSRAGQSYLGNQVAPRIGMTSQLNNRQKVLGLLNSLQAGSK